MTIQRKLDDHPEEKSILKQVVNAVEQMPPDLDSEAVKNIIEACRNKLLVLHGMFDRQEGTAAEYEFGKGMKEICGDMIDQLDRAWDLIESYDRIGQAAVQSR